MAGNQYNVTLLGQWLFAAGVLPYGVRVVPLPEIPERVPTNLPVAIVVQWSGKR